MTVKELAKYLKLSEVMVYKLAQNGEIPASKIGSIWRFAQDEIDEWLMKNREPDIPANIKETVSDIVCKLKKEFRENLSTVLIFGSFARGDASLDSDLDLLIVLKKIKEHWKTDKKIHEIVYSCTFEKDRAIVVSPLLISEVEFFTDRSPVILNIRKEGIRAA